MGKKILFIYLIIFFISNVFAYSETINLKTGDRVSGQIVYEDAEIIEIKTESMGNISIDRAFIDVLVDEKEEPQKTVEKEEKLWGGDLSLGYNRSGGNTQNAQLNTALNINRKTDNDEFTVKGGTNYSSTNNKMDSQNWRGMVRYAHSFWKKKWYSFYKLEADHDKFATIDYRLIPSVGLGYWFSDKEDWKAMAEAGLGFEHTSYNNNFSDTNEAVLVPRAFFEKKLFASSSLSQDISLYPSLKNTGEYRLHSETAFTTPISDKLSLRLSFIDDYKSSSVTGVKKNDTKFISSLVYAF